MDHSQELYEVAVHFRAIVTRYVLVLARNEKEAESKAMQAQELQEIEDYDYDYERDYSEARVGATCDCVADDCFVEVELKQALVAESRANSKAISNPSPAAYAEARAAGQLVRQLDAMLSARRGEASPTSADQPLTTLEESIL